MRRHEVNDAGAQQKVRWRTLVNRAMNLRVP